MSIKNQNRLTIFASLIVLAAIVALVAMNLIVDKISKIAPQVARQEDPQGSKLTNADPKADPQLADPHKPDAASKMPAKLNRPLGDMRRMHGKSEGEGEQRGSPSMKAPPKPGMQQAQQPDMRQGPPPGYPDPSKMSPDEREAFEREMFLRQQMMQGQPDYPSDYPPEFYNRHPYDRMYEDDYDYDPGYRGQKEDAKNSQVKFSDSHGFDYEEEDEDYADGEYYSDDYLREEDPK